jgi:hypothetical protein
MRKRLETRQEWLTAYLKKQMELLGKAKIEGLAARLAIRKNAPSVVIDDLGALPAIYVSEEIVYTPLKTDISKDLKNGVAVPGAHLETKTRLEIK